MANKKAKKKTTKKKAIKKPVRPKGMGGAKRTKDQRANDLALAVELRHQGYYIQGITDEINARSSDYQISKQTVQQDLIKIRKQWLKSAEDHIGEMLMADVKRIDYLICQATQAWFRSQKEKVVSRIKKRTRGEKHIEVDTESMVRKEQRDGDARHLLVISQLMEQKLRILGMALKKDKDPGDGDAWTDRSEKVRSIMIEMQNAVPGPHLLEHGPAIVVKEGVDLNGKHKTNGKSKGGGSGTKEKRARKK